ncbi:MAG: winged helix-turn-helix transcriptional regulator [Candidatus Thorarchaeota archaeon]
MDAIDKAILFILLGNCRTPYRTLARQLNLTANAVKKRVDNLIKSGVIVRFSVELSLAMIDGTQFIAIVTTDGTEKEEEFINLIGSNEYVRDVGALSGTGYVAMGASVGQESLREVGGFLRGQKCVKAVEFHSLMHDALHGQKTEFSNLQLRVLRSLIEDPRASTREISRSTGLTVKRVRKTLNQLLEGRGVNLGLRWNLSIGDSFVFLLRIHWDEKSASYEEVVGFILENFPQQFYGPLLTATEPLVFIVFVVENFREADQISKKVSNAPFTKSSHTLFGKPSVSFPDLRSILLERMVKDAGY